MQLLLKKGFTYPWLCHVNTCNLKDECESRESRLEAHTGSRAGN